MSETDRATLRHAAELLEDAVDMADEIYAPFAGQRKADLLATAARLREMAG